MRGLQVIRASGKTGFMACSVAVLGFLLAPAHSNSDSASASMPRVENVTVVAKTSPIAARDRDAMQAAIATFVWGLSNGEPAAVWAFAPEEEQAEFGSEEAAYAFFVRAHAPLAYAQQMTFDGIRMEAGEPVARIYIKDKLGLQWQASFTLSRDDAGGWKIIDCWIDPAPGELV